MQSKLFGPLIIDLISTELSSEEAELLAHPLVGGVIYFTRNYSSPTQIQALSKSIRAVKDKPLLIMVDQEGGRVQRFKDQFTRLPPAAFYGQAYDRQAALGLDLAEKGGWLMATELLQQGVDLSLAPVFDLNKGLSSVIGDRAFHQDPLIAVKLARAFIRGMQTAGMAATGKHFPGHGSVAPDSHLELPVDPRPFETIEKEDLQPFIQFINDKIPALMTAHILFPAVDKMPVSFSSYWLRDILRQRLHFEGVVISDDLNMHGANMAGNYLERAGLACEAGCDLLLVCNNRPAVLQVLDGLPSRFALGRDKYDLLRGRFSLDPATLRENPLWQERRDFLLEHTGLTS